MGPVKKLTTENDVKSIVKKWYDDKQGWHYAAVQSGMGVHGIPDRLGVVPLIVTPAMVGKQVGLFIAVESKRPGRRGEADRGMSRHQKLVVDAIRAAGGLAICCDGHEDLAGLDRELSSLIGA